jgi:hypothetical protein
MLSSCHVNLLMCRLVAIPCLVIHSIAKDIVAAVKKSTTILNSIRKQQRKYYSEFDEIILKLEEINWDNALLTGLNLLEDPSLKQKSEKEKISLFLPGKTKALHNLLNK